MTFDDHERIRARERVTARSEHNALEERRFVEIVRRQNAALEGFAAVLAADESDAPMRAGPQADPAGRLLRGPLARTVALKAQGERADPRCG